MAAITTYLTADKLRPDSYPDATPVWRKLTTVSAGNSADSISLETLKAGETIMNAFLYQDATMGASCTLQLRVDTTALTAATTQGAAGGVAQTIACATSASDRTVNILIGGANVGGTANVYVSYMRVVAPV